MKGIQVALLGAGLSPAELERAVNAWLVEHHDTDVIDIKLAPGSEGTIAMIVYHAPKAAGRKPVGFSS